MYAWTAPAVLETVDRLLEVKEYRLAWKCLRLAQLQDKLNKAKKRHNQRIDEAIAMAERLQVEIDTRLQAM